MQHDTISGYNGFFDNATGDHFPHANALKSKYNIPNALNIYTTDCIGYENTTTEIKYACKSGRYGVSLYPHNLSSNEPGLFIVHAHMPGSNDTSSPNIATLAHELGHTQEHGHLDLVFVLCEKYKN